MKIVTIVGARPQFVKAAAVGRVLRSQRVFREILVHTGQHYDENMSDIFFEEMEIPRPDYHLGIGGGTHGAMTGQMLEKIEEVLLSEKPDWTLVYGDTNSTLAGALASVKLHIPVAHVEAGLRSFNRRMPEEVNRIATDHISNMLFAPTQTAVDNLRREGIPESNIVLTGDVMLDATFFYRDRAREHSNICEGLPTDGFALCTIHRAENTDDPKRLASIVAALDEVASSLVPVILPLHPRTHACMSAQGLSFEYVTVIDPVGYFDMISLLDHCSIVLTDSGGVQKESYFFEKQCVTLRDETEWIELVKVGANQLAGSTYEKIVSCAEGALRASRVDLDWPNLYGDGLASEKIACCLSAPSKKGGVN